jgi:hypothetical protein
MNPKSIFDLFSSRGKVQAGIYQGVSTLIISLVMLSLAVLTGYVQTVQASGPESGDQLSIEALRNIDPADRKFFNPGYGAYTIMPGGTEGIQIGIKERSDPDADIGLLEFFSPEYRANSGKSEEANVVPAEVKNQIDPDADVGLLEFFSPEYRVNSGESEEAEVVRTRVTEGVDPDADIGLLEFFSPADQAQVVGTH